MPLRLPKSIAGKLILWLTAFVVLAEGGFGLIQVHNEERQLLNSMVLGADQLSRSIVSATWHAMLLDRRDAAYEVMRTIALKQGIDRIRIFNKDGRVTFSTAAEQGLQVDKRAEACFLCHAEERPLVKVDVPNRARTFRAADGDRKLAIIAPVYNEPACSSAECHAHPAEVNVLGVLDVSLDLAAVDAEIAAIRTRMVIAVAIEILLLSLLIAGFTRRFVSTPIRELIDGTRALSKMQLDRPLSVRASGELEELAQAIDVMRERLRVAVGELNEMTHTLERKVQERTEQLGAARQKLALSERLASLGQLAATVAHEINNPLAGVLNLSMLLRKMLREEGVPPDRLAEFRGFLEQVSNETARAGRIVADLLSFARQSGPVAGRADLNAVVHQTLAALNHRLEGSGIRVALQLADELPEARGDSAQIQQVVMNLVVNAVEAMPQGGVLTIRTWADATGPGINLEVEDQGIGIAEDHLERVFDPFFTTKELGKGVGLGLAVAYGIVQAHNGQIEVTSRAGCGATFHVQLPVAGRRNGERRGDGG